MARLMASAGGKRSPYLKVTPHQKATIAKHAANSSSAIFAFGETMVPVTIHMHAHACLTIVWRCPYILGLGWASTARLDLTVNCEFFPGN